MCKGIGFRAGLALVVLCLAALVPRSAAADAGVGEAVTFSCADDEATVAARGGPRASFNGATVYAGYRQAAANNKNPLVAQFDAGGVQTWCRTDYETTGVDGTAYGVLWDEGGLYIVFSVDGGSYDFNFGTSGGWLPSYGSGGGPKVAVIARLDPATGDPLDGTFVSAVLSDGKTNSLVVRELCWVPGATGDGHLRVVADSWYAPRRADGSRMPNCAGSSPLDYAVDLSASLTGALAVSSFACREVDPDLSLGCILDPRVVYLPLVLRRP